VSSVGYGSTAFFQSLLDGTVSIEDAPWRPTDLRAVTWWAGIRDFEPYRWLSDKVADGTDVFSQFALAAASMAIEQAGITELPARRTAVVHGTSMGGMRALLLAQHLIANGRGQEMDRKTMIKIWPNMAASQMAMRWNLHGPQLTISTACASSLDAIGTAARMIESGHVTMAIAGGTGGGMYREGDEADDFIPAYIYNQTLFKMSAPDASRLEASRPFDAHRTGIVNGDGSAILVLEAEQHARARGAEILGYVRGYGSLADAYHPSSPDPSGRWEAAAMTDALDDADIDADAIDALIAHATGTPAGDAGEIEAINAVFGDRGNGPVTMSIKGHIGHTGAASGAMGTIVALKAMSEGVVPHTAGTTVVDPLARFRVVTRKPIEIPVDVAQVNSFGFGGQNASLVVGSSRHPAGGSSA
jgi:3-oxoacyl-[acyl-carrier-protein] synthase II